MGGLSRLSAWKSSANAAATYRVPTATAADLLARHGIRHVDFMSIDVEGAELEVLESINWNETTVDVICIETLSLAPVYFLLSKSFVVWRVVFSDIIMVHTRFLRREGIDASAIGTALDTDGGVLRREIMRICDTWARANRGIVGRVKCRQTILHDQLLLSGLSAARSAGLDQYFDRAASRPLDTPDVEPFGGGCTGDGVAT